MEKQVSAELRDLIERFVSQGLQYRKLLGQCDNLGKALKEQGEKEGLSHEDIRFLIESELKKRKLSDRHVRRLLPKELKRPYKIRTKALLPAPAALTETEQTPPLIVTNQGQQVTESQGNAPLNIPAGHEQPRPTDESLQQEIERLKVELEEARQPQPGTLIVDITLYSELLVKLRESISHQVSSFSIGHDGKRLTEVLAQ